VRSFSLENQRKRFKMNKIHKNQTHCHRGRVVAPIAAGWFAAPAALCGPFHCRNWNDDLSRVPANLKDLVLLFFHWLPRLQLLLSMVGIVSDGTWMDTCRARIMAWRASLKGVFIELRRPSPGSWWRPIVLINVKWLWNAVDGRWFMTYYAGSCYFWKNVNSAEGWGLLHSWQMST
jgi:hypothetical protein